MDNLDIRTVLPLLKQLGINPDNMSPEKIQKLMEKSPYVFHLLRSFWDRHYCL